jgi:ATP phosphoribosyltransferase regulatory subunit
MALQPAAGARDLNPREVEANRWLCEQLAGVYRMWGYAEVSPPAVERLETLEAGGSINDRELVRVAAAEPLGLRPEMTASIARAACTRLGQRPRPLRLWSAGSVFRTVEGETGPRFEERFQSGVELLGDGSLDPAAGDGELLLLLLACLRQLGITAAHRPVLLVGHHAVLTTLLGQVPEPQRVATRRALIQYDPLALAQLDLPGHQRQALQGLMRLRGDVEPVLYQLEQLLGPTPVLDQLAHTLTRLAPAAARQGVTLQLDPSFQPHFDLYDGLVLKLVCRGAEAPVAIASGGRYDALVSRFGGTATGLGFGVDVEAVRELLGTDATAPVPQGRVLVAWATAADLGPALALLEQLHGVGQAAELHHQPCGSATEAEAIARQRLCSEARWIQGAA